MITSVRTPYEITKKREIMLGKRWCIDSAGDGTLGLTIDSKDTQVVICSRHISKWKWNY